MLVFARRHRGLQNLANSFVSGCSILGSIGSKTSHSVHTWRYLQWCPAASHNLSLAEVAFSCVSAATGLRSKVCSSL